MLALQPTIGFSLLSNFLPFRPFLFSMRAVQFHLLSSSQRFSFYRAGLSALRPIPNLEDQGIPFCVSSALTCLAWEALLVALRYRQHSSWVHLTTQAPPLRQSRDTY
jgi:hypothetical protein